MTQDDPFSGREELTDASWEASAERMKADLDLAFTMLEIARTTSDPEQVKRILSYAKDSAELVLRSREKLENEMAAAEISESLNALEAALSALSTPDRKGNSEC